MKSSHNKSFFFSLTLTLTLGLIFLFLILPPAQAIDVDVTAQVSSSGVCGNGTVEAGEGCDDGNTTDCDGCKGDCSRADDVCGDSIIECGEECESDSDCGVGVSCTNCVCGIPCFLAGTQISLSNNQSLAIEEIQVGDIVLSYNEATAEMEPARVLQTFKHQAEEYLLINNELKVTDEHPLYINSRWQKASVVKVGDRLLNQEGVQIIVSSVEIIADDVLVYNLEVDKNHNYFAQKYLAHNKGECIPTCVGKECGPSNCPGISCGICPAGFNCIGFQCVSACGNGALDAGEECDDGNTVSGDGCSATCQLEGGCGDGNLDPGEECDDDNTVSGDCCSASCQIELHVRNVTVSSVSSNSATVSWSTYSWQNNACQPVNTNSVLDWGQNIPPTEGTVSLSDDNYSYSISGLDSGTIYNYLITATLNALTDTYSGSFQTSGPAEICGNGIDDDNDGLVDYLDSDCYCEAIYDCTAWTPVDCPPSGVQTRICEWINSDVCWNSQPTLPTSQSCTPGCDLTCGPCQSLNIDLCICENITPCCGNDICEPWAVPPETYETCPQDCEIECIPNWECSEWSECIDGIQTRECYDLHACGTNLGRPDEIQGCGQCTISCGFCQSLNVDQCICEDLVPCCGNLVCELGETYEICPQDCVQPCIPNWVPTGWSECINGVQTRTYQDLNNCPYALVPPPDQRSCLEGCEIACGVCQQLDLTTCRCLPRIPCCGNRICEIDWGENSSNCPVDCAIPPDFKIALSQCLDGLDNDKDDFIDYPADPGCSSPSDDSELNLAEIIQNVLDNPQVEQVNEIAAPAIAVAVVVNSFATFSFVNFFTYLQFLVSQPIAALFRRKRKRWGVVYNSLSKEPVDLAIVRLYKKENNRIVQSKVTDKLGRYSFLASAGNYYITVTKPKFKFPTVYLKDAEEDVRYLDLYHGGTVEIKEEDSTIVYNIPVDPVEETKPAAKIIFQHYLRKIQKVVAFTAVPLALLSAIISPGVLTFTLLFVHILLFALFYRLGYEKPPKSWGRVLDKLSSRPITRAITRIYDKQYNKLLETRVTDARGRYAFLVNNNIYYLTAEKNGYQAFKSDDINLVEKGRDTIVGFDINLQRLEPGQKPVEPPTPAGPAKAGLSPAGKVGLPAKTEPKPEEPAKPEEPTLAEEVRGLEVGRGSLEDLLKTKEKAKEIQKDIDQKQEELEGLEDKVEDVRKDIDERLAELDHDKTEEEKSEIRDKKSEEEPKDNAPKPPEEKSIFG